MTFTKLSVCLASFAYLSGSAAFAADIKVGAAGGLTGPVPELAAAIQSMRDLVVKQINADGGLLKGDTMRLVIADSGCDPKTAVDAIGKLVNIEQVVSILGPTCSGETIASAQTVTVPANVLIVTESATSPMVSTIVDNDLVFRTTSSDSDQGKALAGYAIKAGVKDVAMIVANDDYDVGLRDVFKKEFEAAGGKITASQTVEPAKASYRSDLATLSAGGSRTLVVFMYYNAGGVVTIKNSLEGGLFDTFYGAGGIANQAGVDQIGADNLRGHLYAVIPAPDVGSASYKPYADAARAASLDPNAPYVANAYDATFLTALAIEKAGAADRKKLSAALRAVSGPEGEIVRPGEWAKAKQLIAAGKEINYEGASGKVDFDKNGDVQGSFALISVQENGKLEEPQSK